MIREEAIPYLDAMMKENKFVYPYREEALTMAVAALREREQLEQGCEYCNEGESICNRDEDIRISGNILRIDIGCYAYSQVEINFCPMCGRRLPQPPKGE